MKSVTASSLALSVVGNPILTSLLILMVMIAGLVSGSFALVIVSAVLAFGRPIFYCALYSSKDDAEKSTAIASDRPASFDVRPSNRAMVFDVR